MNCVDAAEFVSALCDGETILSEAAEHIGTCEVCRAHLSDYLAMGVELRRVASLESAVPVPTHTWQRPQNTIANWWQKGLTTMRIPRFAFAVLIAGIVFLASALTVAKVRARDTGTVVLLTTTGPAGRMSDCPLSTVDPKWTTCGWFGDLGSISFGYKVDLLSRDGDRVRLAIRSRAYPKTPGTHNFSPLELHSKPQKEVWFKPGEPLKVDLPDVGTLTLTGKWLDHVPVILGTDDQNLTPGPDELRFASPLLLKDKRVAGDLEGCFSSTSAADPASAVWVYISGQGSFLLSPLHIKGAVEAHVSFSRVSFEANGHSWDFVTGAPVSRADHLWVLYKPNFKTRAAGQNTDTSFLGIQMLVQAEPGLWMPKNRTN